MWSQARVWILCHKEPLKEIVTFASYNRRVYSKVFGTNPPRSAIFKFVRNVSFTFQPRNPPGKVLSCQMAKTLNACVDSRCSLKNYRFKYYIKVRNMHHHTIQNLLSITYQTHHKDLMTVKLKVNTKQCLRLVLRLHPRAYDRLWDDRVDKQ